MGNACIHEGEQLPFNPVFASLSEEKEELTRGGVNGERKSPLREMDEEGGEGRGQSRVKDDAPAE